MTSRILRLLTATVAVGVVGAAAIAAAAASDPAAAADPAAVTTVSAPADDRGHRDAAAEDRAPRTEVREEDGRRETRTELPHPGTQTHDVADAGTVTVSRDGATLTITDVAPAAGWHHTVERSAGPDVEVTFRRDGRRVDFQAEIEHPWVKVRVRER